MNNKTDIEEDIRKLERVIKLAKITGVDKTLAQAIENILADREKLIIEKEIQEDNYEDLSADVSNIAKKLDLQEDATIDEIHIAIRILKSKRTNMFEYTDKANKYDSLVEKINNRLEYTENLLKETAKGNLQRYTPSELIFMIKIYEELLKGE